MVAYGDYQHANDENEDSEQISAFAAAAQDVYARLPVRQKIFAFLHFVAEDGQVDHFNFRNLLLKDFDGSPDPNHHAFADIVRNNPRPTINLLNNPRFRQLLGAGRRSGPISYGWFKERMASTMGLMWFLIMIHPRTQKWGDARVRADIRRILQEELMDPKERFDAGQQGGHATCQPEAMAGGAPDEPEC